MNDPTIRLAAKSALEIAAVMDPAAPPPEAIAAFMDTVRRLNNSHEWGEVDPGASVWRWLEGLSS